MIAPVAQVAAMKLHWSPRSPFVRKVMVVLHERGLIDQVTLVRSPVALDGPVNAQVLADSPLGKIPVLVRPDGPALFDSRVICAYLDTLGPAPRLIPDGTDARIDCLRREALADGLTDMLLLWRTLVRNGLAEGHAITASYRAKIPAALARIESELPALEAEPFGLGHVAIACALGQLDFRYPQCNWRVAYPTLGAWWERTARRPSLQATAVPQDPADGSSGFVMPLRFDPAQGAQDEDPREPV